MASRTVLLSAVACVAFVAVAYLRRWRWTGFRNTGQEVAGRTLWDWLQLLLVPVGIALALFALNNSQANRERARAERQAAQDRLQANRRAANDRAIANQRARGDTVRVYLQQMSNLLLDHDLRHSRIGSDVRVLARTLTLTVLPQLDGERKGLVLQFLSEQQLINPPQTRQVYAGDVPLLVGIKHGVSAAKVSLEGADLSGLVWGGGRELEAGDLSGANLRGARFIDARLGQIGRLVGHPSPTYTMSFSGADLRGARFDHAELSGVKFRAATLADASFRGTFMQDVSMRFACLSGSSFADSAEFTLDLRYTTGDSIDFSRADLHRARLLGTTISDVTLSSAIITGTVVPAEWNVKYRPRVRTIPPSPRGKRVAEPDLVVRKATGPERDRARKCEAPSQVAVAAPAAAPPSSVPAVPAPPFGPSAPPGPRVGP
jgi:uncharacterized protein YjbI with pentapeptide repeats